MPRPVPSSLLRANPRTLLTAFATVGVLCLFGLALFVRSKEVIETEIKERLRTVAVVAAMQMQADDIQAIRDRRDLPSPALVDTVWKLRRLRDSVEGIRYAYILRRTGDPMTLEFVADADTLSSEAELDVNGNGSVDDDELPSFPGDAYDISEIPALQEEAFQAPTTDEDMTVDAWGALMSGYAPIRDPETNEVVGVLGVDMLAEQYNDRAYGIFSPVTLFMLLLGACALTAGFVMLGARGRIDELERMNDERSRLLQWTFHQLGEPMTVFKWSVEMIRESTTDAERLENIEQHLACMDQGLSRMDGILDALVEAERVEKRTMPYKAVDVRVSELVDKAMLCFRGKHPAEAEAVKATVQGGLVVSADPGPISDVLCKLLQNAADYSSGKSDITLSVAKRADVALFSVADRGDGISAKDLSQIAEKYHRGAKAHLRKPDGKGLGLYTARGIVEMAGGKLWIKSVEGKGTTVFFTLPLA
jgi:signal transduction histidine kinase